MKSILIAFIAFTLSCFSYFGFAQEVEHFEGKPSPTLEAALANLTQFNAELEVLIEQESLSPEDHHQIHELTYTLENAMKRLNEEQLRLSELLEEVHLASERADSETVKASGSAFLKGTAPLMKSPSE